MTPVIRFHEVSKRYGAEVALDRFSLEVPGGSVFALLGENGAGKTTAIRILLGLAEPDSGQSEVLGLAGSSQGLEIRRRVGYVPERLTLYEWMTVEEIGWFTAGFYGERFLPEYRRLAEQFGLPAAAQDQIAFQGDAGQGGPVAGHGPRSGSAGAGRADLGPGRPGPPRIPGEHGGPGGDGQDRLPLQPSDRGGGTRGRHRGHPPPGPAAARRAAR